MSANPDRIATSSATSLAAMIRTRTLTSSELLEIYLDRITRLNGPLNAVVTIDEQRARREAKRADDEAESGLLRGPLHGLPITIKDAIETEGIRSTGGAIELTNHIPKHDAPAVARLKTAGAIVFGKTNVPRWSGEPQTFNEIFGTTNNPWDVTRTPAGSSGGAAAAVASGFTSFELGTDIGGSVRMPAHCCGIFGLKPSYGVISQRGYLDRVGGGTNDVDINVFGPLARSADDLELLLGVLAGPDPQQTPAWQVSLAAPRQQDVSKLRVGVWFEQPNVPIDSEVLAMLNHAAQQLESVGASVELAHPPIPFEEQNNLFFQLISAAISPSMPGEIAEVMGGSHLAWLAAQQRRAELKLIWAQWFEQFDVLLCPALPTPAFPHDQTGNFLDRRLLINGESHSHTALLHWQGLIGLMELPSVSTPIGRTKAGLPVGMQVVAAYLRDREAIAVAKLVAETTGGYSIPPGF